MRRPVPERRVEEGEEREKKPCPCFKDIDSYGENMNGRKTGGVTEQCGLGFDTLPSVPQFFSEVRSSTHTESGCIS